MLDGRQRVLRELFLAGFSADIAGVEPWVKDRLTSIMEEDFAPAGEEIFRAGDPPEFFFFPRDGHVHLQGREGQALPAGSERVVGLLDVLIDRPRPTTALAATDLTFMKIRADDWMDLLEDSFRLARLMVLGMAREAAEAEQRAWSPAAPPSGRARPGVASSGRLSLLERMALFLDVPLLRGAGVQALSDLASLSEESVLDARQPLFHRGEPRDRMYIVVEGAISAFRERSSPERRWRPGQIVCEAASFGDPARAWSAHAACRARALSFRVEDWFDLMETHFEMLRSTLAALATERERFALVAPPEPS